MLLAVVHANGMYQAHLDEHDPIKTYDPEWKQEPYHERLADEVDRQLSLGNKVLYLAYWNNAHLTDVFEDDAMRKRAFDGDPLLKVLGSTAQHPHFEALPTASGNNAEMFGHNAWTEHSWRKRLVELTHEERGAYFVGAYTSACVAQVAEYARSRTDLPIYIDPSLSVDTHGEGYVPIWSPITFDQV
jgi:hypothetical protein